MDEVDWDQGSYDYIVNRMQNFLDDQCLENIEVYHFLPISGLQGQNILKSPKDEEPRSAWYTGPALFGLLDQLESKTQEFANKPFRLLISHCFTSTEHGKKGFLIAGRIEGGVAKKGDKLVIKPPNVNISIKDIYIDDCKKDAAIAGELVEFIINFEKTEKEMDNIKPGQVLSSHSFQVPLGKKFVCNIITYALNIPILTGTRCSFFVGSSISEGLISKLLEIRDPKTGEVIKKNPR